MSGSTAARTEVLLVLFTLITVAAAANSGTIDAYASGYQTEGLVGYLYPPHPCPRPPGTVPLYHYFNPVLPPFITNNHHFYTTNKQEGDRAVAYGGFYSEGIAGYLYLQQQSGPVPLYRYYNPGDGDHFYTINKTEGDNAVAHGGYRAEGIAGYLYHQQQPGTAAFLRYYNPVTGDHFYTTYKREGDNAVAHHGFQAEGIAGYLYPQQQPGTGPLYRYVNPVFRPSVTNNHHFYTTNKTEGDNATANGGFRPEGIVGYLYPQQQPGAVPLYRYYNPAGSPFPTSGDHFYTTNKTEGDIAVAHGGYRAEGITGYLYPLSVRENMPPGFSIGVFGTCGVVSHGFVFIVDLISLYNPTTGDHLYTTNRTEATEAAAPPPPPPTPLTLFPKPPPLPVISFDAEPRQVHPNEQTILTWVVRNCDPNCSVHITKRVPFVGSDILIRDHLRSSGSIPVAVDTPNGAFYKLWASTPASSATSDEKGVGIIGEKTPSVFSAVSINNQHVDHRSVNIWTFDNGQWKDQGSLDYGSTETVTLASGHSYIIVAVDQGAINCSGNSPLSCLRFETPSIRGDKGGGTLTYVVS